MRCVHVSAVIASMALPASAQPLRSVAGDYRIEVTWKNQSQQPVSVHWVDYEGVVQPGTEIEPGGEAGGFSFATHVFVFKQDGRQIGYVELKPSPARQTHIIAKAANSNPTSPAAPDRMESLREAGVIPSAGAVGALGGTFDTTASQSEQRTFAAHKPTIVAAPSANGIVVAWQQFAGGEPVRANVGEFRVGEGGMKATWLQPLPLPMLAGMTTDGKNIYALSAANEDLGQDASTVSFRPDVLQLTKLSAAGQPIWTRDLNSAQYLGANVEDGKTASAIYSPMTAGTGAIAYGNGNLVIVLASNTVPDSGGLRHQRAQYFVVSAADGSGSRSAAETSWRHSFDQRVVFHGNDFVIMDLADAGWYMPGAGITVRKVRPDGGQVQFLPTSPEGVYIYARQSETAGSQNFSFISMGDIAPGTRGFGVLFSSERNNNVKQRSGWEVPIAEPRNVGFVSVRRDFERATDATHYSDHQPRGSRVPGNVDLDWRRSQPVRINITKNVIDSNGPVYRFQRPGDASKSVSGLGVVWLTNLQQGVSAERPKLVPIDGGGYVGLWELWSYRGTNITYQSTQAARITERGQLVGQPVTINARLNPSGADRPFLMNGKVTWVTGDGSRLQVNRVDADLRLQQSIVGR